MSARLTRRCPHRLCRPLHRVLFAVCSVGVLEDLARFDWRMLCLGLTAGCVAALVFYRSVGARTIPEASNATNDTERIVWIRRGWARVAVGCDAAELAVLAYAVTVTLPGFGRSSGAIAFGPWDLAVVAGVAAFLVFGLYAHWKASRPRRPRRAWQPALFRSTLAKEG